MPLSLRRNRPLDLDPLERLLADPDDLAKVNPHAKHPLDPFEWGNKWLGEPDDASYYLVDDTGREVGFIALRVGIGPEVRLVTYVFVEEASRGGTGEVLIDLAEEAARDLGALSIMLKAETDNPAALRLYEKAGYETLGERETMVTMRKDLA